MPETYVTVVTITRRRIELLNRAIASVRAQDWAGGCLTHLVVADDCEPTARWLSGLSQDRVPLTSVVIRRGPHEESGPSRLARLRNRACEVSQSDWIAFLDDDNQFERCHIRTLLECAEASGCPAVHSYRKLFHVDGRPFVEPYWPWCRDEHAARMRYQEYVSKGVLKPKSNIVRERADPAGHSGRVMQVDTNVWLLRRDLLLRYRISDEFTAQDWMANLAEDDKLLETLVAAGVPIATTAIPSVRYYLGGYSNDFDAKHGRSEVWRSPVTVQPPKDDQRACTTSQSSGTTFD